MPAPVSPTEQPDTLSAVEPAARPTSFASLTEDPYMRRLFAQIDRDCEAHQRAERALYRSMRARTIGEVMESNSATGEEA